MFRSGHIKWITDTKEFNKLDQEGPWSVVACVRPSAPDSKRFLHKYAWAAAELHQSHPAIELYAVDAEEYPDLEEDIMPRDIPMPHVLVCPNTEPFYLKSSHSNFAKRILKMYPGTEASKPVERKRVDVQKPSMSYDEERRMEARLQEYSSRNKWGNLALYYYEDPDDLRKVSSTLEALSAKSTGELKYRSLDINKSNRAHYLDENPRKTPYFVIDIPAGMFEDDDFSYGIENPSAEAIEQFVEDYLAGNLKPSFKSEPIPTKKSFPTKLVGFNHDEVLADTSKAFFVQYYPENRRDRVINELQSYASGDKVIVAELNLPLNTVDIRKGWYYYPAGPLESGKRVTIRYPYAPVLEKFEEFLEAGGPISPWIPEVSREDLDDYLSSHEKVVVSFYHGNPYLFEFDKVAQALRESNPEVKFVKVAVDKLSGGRILSYHKGREVQNRAMIHSALDMLQDFYPVSFISSEEELDSLIESKILGLPSKPLVVQINTQSEVYANVASALKSRFKFMTLDTSVNDLVARKFHTSFNDAPAWMWIYPESYGDVQVYHGEEEPAAFEDFLKKNVPLFGPTKWPLPRATSGIYATYFYLDLSDVHPLRENFEAMARQHPHIVFEYAPMSYMDVKFKYLRHFKKPVFVIDDPSVYVLDPTGYSTVPSSEAITNFLTDYLDKKLEPFEPPEEWPLPQGQLVVELNELNAKMVVRDSSKDVVIWYDYGRKRPIVPLLKPLAEHFASNENVLIAQIDLNECGAEEPFPVYMEDSCLVLYPANGETYKSTGWRKPVIYDGPCNLESLINFVRTGTPVLELTAATLSKFLENSKVGVLKLYRSSCPRVKEDAIFYDLMAINQQRDFVFAQIDLDKETGITERLGSTKQLAEDGGSIANIRVVRNEENQG
ncbi:hypothetical protein DICA1_F34662 [Diutina catenulata]